MRNGSIGNGVARVENVEARPAANYPRKQSKALTGIEVKSAIPKRRQDLLKWNGWGYKDSEFILKDDVIAFTGDRYPIGNLELPYFTDWVHIMFDVDVNIKTDRQPLPKETDYPRSLAGPELVQEFEDLGISTSIEGIDRLIRSHGQTLHDIDVLRRKVFTRIPDIVLWPTCHEEVVEIVKVADKRNLVIIPYGGGTSVSGAVGCPEEERRVIISLDTSQMNDILWVDSSNLVVCCESGILGQDLERELRKLGYTAGHEPDSYEFSSLGGWVATRASGMKKNTYGNIEDLVVHVRMVTPRGVLEKGCRVPRISCGPDFQQVILGSEGSLGVVTEVVLKIRPLPKCIKYGSLVFPEFESGVKCMREVARERCQPSSIRLMDNEQFKFGQALRPVPSYFGYFMDGIKHLVLTKVKGFDLNQICVATLLFEGNAEDVAVQEKKINAIAAQFGGIAAGQTNGERGYVLTFVIAYIRDLAYNYDIIAESFETSVPWDRTSALCRNVKHRVRQECKHHSIKHFLISCRVTQTYDAGACVYFYFGFHSSNFENAMEIYELIEERARDEIIACGGSISHHHGVGKLRKKWYQQTVSVPGLELYQATKRQLDPKNIFANANLVDTVTEDSGSSQDVLAKSKL